MKRILIFILVTGYSFLVTLPASASYISLQTTVNSVVAGNILTVSVSSVNKGDELAHNVQAEVWLGEKKVVLKKVPELRVNGVYRDQRSFKLDQKLLGEYPLIVAMHYADANLYPFSALNCQTFVYRTEDSPSEVFGQIKNATFWKEGKLRLTLRNLSNEEIKTSTRLVTPRELSAKQGSLDLVIAAKGRASAVFQLENFSALNGSSYQVFAVTEHEKEGVHRTAITPGMIRIVETRTILGLGYNAVLILLILLVLVFIAAQFIKRK